MAAVAVAVAGTAAEVVAAAAVVGRAAVAAVVAPVVAATRAAAAIPAVAVTPVVVVAVAGILAVVETVAVARVGARAVVVTGAAAAGTRVEREAVAPEVVEEAGTVVVATTGKGGPGCEFSRGDFVTSSKPAPRMRGRFLNTFFTHKRHATVVLAANVGSFR